MDYQEVVFTITSPKDYHQDLLIDALAQIGFDSFEEYDSGFKAYIPYPDFDQDTLNDIVSSFKNQLMFSHAIQFVPHTNWNDVWEQNFTPLKIANTCYVRATFHEPDPTFPYEIIIDPKMAFGTGHHQTTALVMEFMLQQNFNNKLVLDMGCGTGILAILAAKLGAKKIVAIDNDAVCYASTLENSKLNDIATILAVCGSKEAIPSLKFDVILANINRNILLDQLASYESVLADGGTIFLSGFYEGLDLSMLIEKANTLKLEYVKHNTLNNWVAAQFMKVS